MFELRPKIVPNTCVCGFFSFTLTTSTKASSSKIMQLVLVAKEPVKTVWVDLPFLWIFSFSTGFGIVLCPSRSLLDFQQPRSDLSAKKIFASHKYFKEIHLTFKIHNCHFLCFYNKIVSTYQTCLFLGFAAGSLAFFGLSTVIELSGDLVSWL